VLLHVREEGSGYKDSPRDRLSRNSPFCLLINGGSIQKLPLTSTSFPIYYSLIILSFDALWAALLTVSVNILLSVVALTLFLCKVMYPVHDSSALWADSDTIYVAFMHFV